MAIAKGTQVRQVMPTPVEGVIIAFDVDQNSGELQYLVKWEDADGEHTRFFKESEIEVI